MTGELRPAIEIRGVTKKFRLYTDRKTNLKEAITSRRRTRHEDFYALRDVTLDVALGKTFGLIGHNGSGKSTLLKLIAGIHRPTAGTVTAHGRVSAMLELGAGFHPELSGRDNVFLNGAILGMSRKQVAAAMDSIIEFSGLEEFIDTPVKVYSSGMYVRLGFAIAVNLDPEILIIDEVIAVGDEEFQRRCFDHLHGLRRRGVTIVLVSHSLGLVQTLCDEVAWLDRGELRDVGAAGHVTQAYLREVNEAELHGQNDATASDVFAESSRQGTHEIVITRVEFLGPDGRESNRLIAGENARFRIHYAAREPVERPVVGIGIYTENDTYVTGDHMRLHGLDIGTVTGDGYVDVEFDALGLNPGSYLVTAAITDWSLAHQYDLWDHAFELRVRPGAAPEYHGLVRLDAKWIATVRATR
jgi:lipopolysaccharide transport system ATP-binding protein